MLARSAAVVGLGLLALCVCVSIRLLSGSAPVLLAGEAAGGGGGGGLLSKELAQDARMLATLQSGPPGRIAQAGWGGKAAKHGTAAHTRERHEMMSRYGAVPASWCAPVRPPLLLHSCTHVAGTSACQDTVRSADIGIQLGVFLRVWRAHH